ncbi:hypothetical protein LIER_16894 [Lithospermum erythrorhizon]|uniref:Uncharacterized protein n=1 Tax=Lithospermum erythrorhizon TaxID=34254 RepID=A0AAV3Q8C9_LITER
MGTWDVIGDESNEFIAHMGSVSTLKLGFMEGRDLSMLASQLGKLLFVDRPTSDMGRPVEKGKVVEVAPSSSRMKDIEEDGIVVGKIVETIENKVKCVKDVECKGKESEGKKVDANVQVEDGCIDRKVTPVNSVVRNNTGNRYLMLNNLDEGLDDDSSQHTNEEEGENKVLMPRFLDQKKGNSKSKKTKKKRGQPLENKVKLAKHEKVFEDCSRGWKWIHNENDQGCRIWVAWEPNVCDIVSCVNHSQHIRCSVVGTQYNFFLSAVYGSNDHAKRKNVCGNH